MFSNGWALSHGLSAPAPAGLLVAPPRVEPPQPEAGGRTRRSVASRGIGAPFVYLASARPPADSGSGTIYYPYHASEWNELIGSHDALIGELREREGVEETTVCLYVLEYQNPTIRRAYESAGFRVITHGRRDDPTFLRRQLQELAAHTVVATNRVSTALWYGGHLGRRMRVFGDVFGAEAQGGPGHAADEQSRLFGPLLDGSLSPDDERALADAELGADLMRPAAELRSLLTAGHGARRLTVERQVALAEHRARAVGHRALGRWIAPRATTGEARR